MAYDLNTDYQAIINDSVAKQDFVSAAKAEQSRNEKIAYLDANGLNKYNAVPTTQYQSYLNGGQSVPQPAPAPYQPSGIYNDTALSEADRLKVDAFKQQYDAAKASGNQEGMAAAHAGAEAIRGQYGYSGGDDGSEYWGLEMLPGQIPQTALPTYQPQTEQVNNVYDAALEAQKAALEGAYNVSRFEAEQAMKKIPGVYQAQRNATATNAERERMMFNEYAAASGLNSGTGGQAMLAFSNQLQGDLSALNRAEADAITQAQNQLVILEMEYQSAVAEALANNEYERAAALLEEFRMKSQSVVDIAQNQAYLNLSTVQQNQSAHQAEQDRLVQNAETLASFGDFSGYLALGYSPEQVAQMKAVWKAANPDIAWAVS